jgi:hypothetical protein
MGSKAIGKQRQTAPVTPTHNPTHNREYRIMIQGRDLPVGLKPGWELEQPDSDDQGCSSPLKGAAER